MVREYDRRECKHPSWFEAVSYPVDRTGRVKLLAVCEVCGKVLGEIGTDSVL